MTRPWQHRYRGNRWHAQAQLERVYVRQRTGLDKHGQTSLAVPPRIVAAFLSGTRPGLCSYVSFPNSPLALPNGAKQREVSGPPKSALFSQMHHQPFSS
jgi:hypothetical protein